MDLQRNFPRMNNEFKEKVYLKIQRIIIIMIIKIKITVKIRVVIRKVVLRIWTLSIMMSKNNMKRRRK